MSGFYPFDKKHIVLYDKDDFVVALGYGSRAHIAAIERYGLTPFHRASYKIKSLQPSLFD